MMMEELRICRIREKIFPKSWCSVGYGSVGDE